MRTFTIENNPRLKELLETKEALVNQTVKIQEEIQTLHNQLQEQAQGVQAVKDDIMLAAHETVMAECNEREMPGTIKLEDGVIVVEIFDVVEEQLKQTAEEKEKLNNRMVDIKRGKKKTASAVAKRAKKKK